ncbi:MAG: iron-containing alcohol dehydrogenase [Erysipelotrichia bacterium]|nr:iron-containing alcohol dehydrogenase [Erysipelotrichia bacterium]NCC54084.1 iron-containing alcohol dehydrogenase [Erysipelotrichia bacterium]
MKQPKLYKQEKGIVKNVQKYLVGKKTLIVLGTFQADIFSAMITQSLIYEYECIVFDKECSEKNIQELSDKMKEGHFDSIIGFGGGKIIDVVKAVCYYYPCYLMVIVSSASMNGACSALSVLYDEDHCFDRFLYLNKNPDAVLVDSEVIFNAPFSLLKVGMIDALSSYYDVMYIHEKKALPKTILTYAQACYDNVYDLYEQVKIDYETAHLGEEVETMIRTILYDSAIAFENCGCEYSHILANATTTLAESRGMHGERVGVSCLFMLALENKEQEYKRLKQLLLALDMPTTLHDLQIFKAEELIAPIMKELKQYQIAHNSWIVEEVLDQIR